MYSLSSVDHIVRLILRFSDLEAKPQSIHEFTKGYRRAISRMFPAMPLAASGALFFDNSCHEAKAAINFMSSTEGACKETHVGKDKSIVCQRIQAALAAICSKNPMLGSILRLVIQSILVSEPPVGTRGIAWSGSVGKAIGTIWVSCQEILDIQDYEEILIHEFTHQILYIEDAIKRQYDYESMHELKNYALTAVTGKKAPLDVVLHSIFVSLELLAYRRSYCCPDSGTRVHPDTQSLIAKANESILSVQSLDSFDELISGDLRNHLDLAKKHLDHYERTGSCKAN